MRTSYPPILSAYLIRIIYGCKEILLSVHLIRQSYPGTAHLIRTSILFAFLIRTSELHILSLRPSLKSFLHILSAHRFHLHFISAHRFHLHYISAHLICTSYPHILSANLTSTSDVDKIFIRHRFHLHPLSAYLIHTSNAHTLSAHIAYIRISYPHIAFILSSTSLNRTVTSHIFPYVQYIRVQEHSCELSPTMIEPKSQQ